MILRGIDFGHVFAASGARNFFKEDGWWYHRYWRGLGLSFAGTTFIAKTTTLEPRAGNMPLRADGVTPVSRRPDCIIVNFRRGVTLNAVALSGPGAAWLLQQGRWQRYAEPFLVSFMAVGDTLDARRRECAEFAALLARHLPDFSTPVGLQVNLSCPNVGLYGDELAREADATLDILGALDIPLVVKVCATLPAELAVYIGRHAACDAIAVSNAIPWGALPDQVDWYGLFGADESPLASYGGGALSGAPLFPIVREWVMQVQAVGITKPIVAGGGVQHRTQVEELIHFGVSALELGAVFLLRPWRVRGIVRRAKMLFVTERIVREIRTAYVR